MKPMKLPVFVLSACLVVYTASGQQLSSYVDFGASFPHVYKGAISTSDNGTYFADGIYEAIEADPGAGELWLNSENANGVYLAFISTDSQWQWAHFIQTNNYGEVQIECKGNAGYVISGSYYGTVDFDPGADTFTLTSGETSDIYVASYDAEGNFEWAVSINGSGYEALNDMGIDNAGNILLGGYFQETADFDPGAAEWLATANDSDFFILKLDTLGSFIWAITAGGEMFDYVRWIDTDTSGNVLVKGAHRSIADMDPGEGEYLLEPVNEFAYGDFIAKYDTGGNFVWAHTFNLGTGSSNESELCQVVGDDEVVWGGWFEFNLDFDPGAGEAWVTENTVGGWFLAKYAGDGSFQWLRSGYGAYVNALATDADGNIYTHGFISQGTGDLDGSEGTMNVNPDGAQQFYCARYNSNGALNWAFALGECYGDDWAVDIEVNTDNQLVVAGLYQTGLDLDPGTGTSMLLAESSTWPLFIAHYNQGACASVSMEITAAENLNCADLVGYINAAFTAGTEPYAFNWNTGETTAALLPESAGIYTVLGTDGEECTAIRSVVVSGPSTGTGHDLHTNITAWTFVPGFHTNLILDGFNEGCGAVNGTLSLTLDPQVVFESANPAPDAIEGNILTWNFTNAVYGDEHLTPQLTLYTPVETALGTLFSFQAEINPSTGDFNAGNNVKTYTSEVVGSYDPNMKEVYPSGIGDEGAIANNQLMTYTVHFQNTGTAPAVNVFILDEIDPDLNISTIQVIASSHDMITEVLDNNTLKFNFPNIQLPDSTNNEPESHGYVIFTIMQQPDLLPLTEIENSAAIYFDFNAPIITNTVLNTIEGPEGIAVAERSPAFQLTPNPAAADVWLTRTEDGPAQVCIYGADGRRCLTQLVRGNRCRLDVDGLARGLYTITLGSQYRRLVIE